MTRGAISALARAGAALALLTAAAAAQQTQPQQTQPQQTRKAPQGFPILVVDKDRVVAESRPARALEETEKRMRGRVEAELARVKAALEAEEKELTELRGRLDAKEFERRTRDFDRRVRLERRAAQERGAQLLRFLENARAALRSALPRVLEALRREKGAAILIDAGAVLAVDPRIDATREAIERYDAEMGDVRFDPPSELQ